MAADQVPPPLVDAAALARAEAALSALSAKYLAWADADATHLTATLTAARTDPAGPLPHLATLFRIAHDMKGQAATFGFPLVTAIGERLCRLIEGNPSPGPDELARIAAHVDALAGAVALRLKGDGGAEGRRLLDSLPD